MWSKPMCSIFPFQLLFSELPHISSIPLTAPGRSGKCSIYLFSCWITVFISTFLPNGNAKCLSFVSSPPFHLHNIPMKQARLKICEWSTSYMAECGSIPGVSKISTLTSAIQYLSAPGIPYIQIPMRSQVESPGSKYDTTPYMIFWYFRTTAKLLTHSLKSMLRSPIEIKYGSFATSVLCSKIGWMC